MKIESINQESEYPITNVPSVKKLVERLKFEKSQNVINISESALALLIRLSVKDSLTKVTKANENDVNELSESKLIYKVYANDGLYIFIDDRAGNFLNQRLNLEGFSKRTLHARKLYLKAAREYKLIDF